MVLPTEWRYIQKIVDFEVYTKINCKSKLFLKTNM